MSSRPFARPRLLVHRDRDAKLLQIVPVHGGRHRRFKSDLRPVGIMTLGTGAQDARSLPHPDTQAVDTVFPVLVSLEVTFTAVQVPVIHVNTPAVLGSQKIHSLAVVARGAPEAVVAVIDDQVRVFFLQFRGV